MKLSIRKTLVITVCLALFAAGALGFFRQLQQQSGRKISQYRNKHLKVTLQGMEPDERIAVCNTDSVSLLRLTIRLTGGKLLPSLPSALGPSICTEIPVPADLPRPIALEAWQGAWEGEKPEWTSQWILFQSN